MAEGPRLDAREFQGRSPATPAGDGVFFGNLRMAFDLPGSICYENGKSSDLHVWVNLSFPRRRESRFIKGVSGLRLSASPRPQ